jgi:hypothetical protein
MAAADEHRTTREENTPQQLTNDLFEKFKKN